MKFSSDDILQQQFETRFRGYDPDQVHEFLDGLAREWDHINDELKRVGHENKTRAQELKEYRRRDRSLHDALEMAKQVAEEVRHQAARDAELTMAEAELKAERILADTEQQLMVYRQDLIQLRQQRIRFEAELRAVIQAHVRMIDEFGPVNDVEDSDVVEQRPEAAPLGEATSPS